MPIRIRLVAEIQRPIQAGSAFGPAHRLACLLLEDGSRDTHVGQDKSFAVRPPLIVPRSSLVEICFQILSDDLNHVERVRERLLTVPPSEVNLGIGFPLQNIALEVSGESWSDLSASAPQQVIHIKTLSPVMFSRSGTSIPLPDPYLTISQLIRRWNIHVDQSRLRIEADVAEEMCRSVSVQSFQIRTQSVKVRAWKTGYTGDVSFVTRSKQPEFQSLFSTLFRFAEYAGIGALTTQCLGSIQVNNA